MPQIILLKLIAKLLELNLGGDDEKKTCSKPFMTFARVLEPAPYFEGQAWFDGQIQTIKLSDYRGKWVVLFFYPFDFTFVCPTEICAFSDASDNFAKINCQVIGASCDSIFVHREFALRERKQGGVAPLKIPLLADNSHEISIKYGCHIFKGENKGATFRATYIIDPKGVIRHISMNDTPVGRSVDEVMRLLQAFQFTDEHGDVCPSNWKPGRKAMKPKPGDPDLKKYFEDELAKQK
jgi:alkyl hydroperoxide reductase subunit AhpC